MRYPGDMITVVRDIEACDRCPFLVFPGEEVIVENDRVIHLDHQLPRVPEPAHPVYV